MELERSTQADDYHLRLATKSEIRAAKLLFTMAGVLGRPNNETYKTAQLGPVTPAMAEVVEALGTKRQAGLLDYANRLPEASAATLDARQTFWLHVSAMAVEGAGVWGQVVANENRRPAVVRALNNIQAIEVPPLDKWPRGGLHGV